MRTRSGCDIAFNSFGVAGRRLASGSAWRSSVMVRQYRGFGFLASIDFPQSSCQARNMTATGLGARYWKLWTSAGLSNLADGVMKVALPLVANRYTDSP